MAQGAPGISREVRVASIAHLTRPRGPLWLHDGASRGNASAELPLGPSRGSLGAAQGELFTSSRPL
eukprot:153229-Pyramimonas_sp.AAC.1